MKLHCGGHIRLSEIAYIGRLHKSGTYDVILKSGLTLEFCNADFDSEDIIMNREVLLEEWLKLL